MKNQKETTQKETTQKKGLNKHDLAAIAIRDKDFNKSKIVTK